MQGSWWEIEIFKAVEPISVLAIQGGENLEISNWHIISPKSTTRQITDFLTDNEGEKFEEIPNLGTVGLSLIGDQGRFHDLAEVILEDLFLETHINRYGLGKHIKYAKENIK